MLVLLDLDISSAKRAEVIYNLKKDKLVSIFDVDFNKSDSLAKSLDR